MVNVIRLQTLAFLVISCLLINKLINANPFQSNQIEANQISNNDQIKLSINNEQNNYVGNVEESEKSSLDKVSSLKDDDDDDDDDDKDGKDNKDDKNNDKDDDKEENKKDDKKDDDKGDEKEDKKPDEKSKKVDEKLDDNQKDTKTEATNFDDSSQEDDSHSNPETEEEGASKSESDEDDKNEEKELTKGKLDKKLLIILASGFRYDYLHIKKLTAIKEILKLGVSAKVRPEFPSNSFPNYYSLMTGLHPIKNGFVDDEMYDTKYKESFPGKHEKHKHWWNKVMPLWISEMNDRIKIGTFWWKGACEITIKGRTPKNCVPHKEKVSHNEVTKQLESIIEQFKENKLDLALMSYEEIDRMGHEFGPESYKLPKAVRNFDKILSELMKEIDENDVKDKVNVVIVSDHGMISVGEKIDLEKFIDFNDIDKFVNTGTFAQILTEDGKEDYVFNLLRNSHIEGLNVYKKPDFPASFKFDKNDNDLLLPIVLTTDKGYYIGEPNIDKDGDDSDDKDDERKKGIHGYHPQHVKEMNAAIFAYGPDFEKNRVVNTIDQVDLYNVFCKLLKIKPNSNDGNKDKVDDFLHDSSSEEHNEEDNQGNSDEDSGDVEDGYAPEKKKNSNVPVYRSRWAVRSGSSNCIFLNSLMQIITLVSLLMIIRI